MRKLINSLNHQLYFISGGIVSYSAPPPDLPGSTNVSLRNVVVGKLDSNILHDGHYGDDVMRATDVPNYGN